MILDFGLVCAVDEEFVSLTSKIAVYRTLTLGDKKVAIGEYQRLHMAVIQSGIGNINAAMATVALINYFNPKIMLFSGIAGALDQDLKVGDVLVGKSAFQAEAITHEQLRVTWDMPDLDKPADPYLLQLAESLYAACPYHIRTGVIVSSDLYPAPKDFMQLFKEKNAQAIDMETAGFYQACHAFSKPCLCIRSFSNSVTNSEKEELSSDLIALSSSHSAEFCFRLIGYFLPGDRKYPVGNDLCMADVS